MSRENELKATTQRVSVALRRTMSRALTEMERRAKAYPSVAVGAAQPPPRGRAAALRRTRLVRGTG